MSVQCFPLRLRTNMQQQRLLFPHFLVEQIKPVYFRTRRVHLDCAWPTLWWLSSRIWSCRYGEQRGVGPGGAWLQNAVPGRVPRVPAWSDADVLEERARGETHLRVPAGLPGGLLHLHGASVPAGGEPVTGMQRGNAHLSMSARVCRCIIGTIIRQISRQRPAPSIFMSALRNFSFFPQN